MIIKFFYEKTDEDYEEYNKLWVSNCNRMIFLQHHLHHKDQLDIMASEVTDRHCNWETPECSKKSELKNKDILAIRFPGNSLNNNKIFNNIKSGKGFEYSKNEFWYPKEVWIYN